MHMITSVHLAHCLTLITEVINYFGAFREAQAQGLSFRDP